MVAQARLRCCQQAGTLAQDLQEVRSQVSRAAHCLFLYRNTNDTEGKACVDSVLAPPPGGVQLPPASYAVATQLYSEAIFRRAMMQSGFDNILARCPTMGGP